MDSDPFMLQILPIYLCTLVELKLKSELFYCAHQLVSAYPSKSIAWFGVGCYYFLLNKLDLARRFFYKTIRMDCFCFEAWIGFGHTFSLSDETDQALLAYRTAQRIFEGSSTAVLNIGMEYVKTNHFIVGSEFLLEASRKAPELALPFNELGVVAFKQQKYKEAAEFFLKCLARVPEESLENWEPTLFNLGHAYRKLK
jgi:anaphase-promoting complex subunit 6